MPHSTPWRFASLAIFALAFSATNLLAQTNVVGAWSQISSYGSASSNAYCAGFFNNNQEIRYGADNYSGGNSGAYWSQMCSETDKPGGQSGLGFYGNTAVDFQCQIPGQTKVLYNLGTFTHFNQPIYAKKASDPVYSESLAGGLLTISLSGETIADLEYFIDFEETPNNPDGYPVGRYNTSTCPYGEFDGACNDRISVDDRVDPDSKVLLDGVSCQIVLEGFGDCNVGASDDVVEFRTFEGETNSACLWASMTTPEDANGSIGDFVWSDDNADGIQDDGEDGVDGVELKLYSSVDNINYFFSATTSTTDGVYQFDELDPELWYKVLLDPSTIDGKITAREQGNDQEKDSDAFQTGYTDAFTINPFQVKTSVDFGIVPQTSLTSLSGLAWIDRSGDGTLESPAELAAPLAGATVNLYRDLNGDGNPDGNFVQTTPTGSDGSYSFSNLNPAINYVLELTDIPSNYPGFAPFNSGSNEAIDSDFDPATGLTDSIDLTTGTALTDIDAGVQPGGIVIVVYDNGDGPPVYNTIEEPGHAQNPNLFMGNILGDPANGMVKHASFGRADSKSVILDDGISGPDVVPAEPIKGFELDVNIVSNAWAGLTCWVDFDQNNSFDDDEKSELQVTGAAVYSLALTTTQDVVPGPTYGRCRLAYDASQVQAPGGLASSGEVEDFPINIGVQLPVELVSFEIEEEGGSVSLSWSTASEVNNAGFSVEQSWNGNAFHEIKFVEGAGTTESQSYYSTRIDGIEPGGYSFRLKQLDHDGRFAYSSVIEIDVEVPTIAHLSDAYPNPFNPSTTIQFSVKKRSQVKVGLYDLAGRLRQTLFDGVQDEGSWREVSIDASELSSGLYLVRLNVEGEVLQKAITLAK